MAVRDDVQILEMKCRPYRGEGAAFDHWSVTFLIGNQKRKYSGRAANAEMVVRDGYFFHTGCTMSRVRDDQTGEHYVFTDELADEDMFAHIERVPPWAE